MNIYIHILSSDGCPTKVILCACIYIFSAIALLIYTYLVALFSANIIISLSFFVFFPVYKVAQAIGNKSSAGDPDEHQAEELSALGKRKRNSMQVYSF